MSKIKSLLDNEEMIYCRCGNHVREVDMIPMNDDESICQECGDKYEVYADMMYERWKEEHDGNCG